MQQSIVCSIKGSDHTINACRSTSCSSDLVTMNCWKCSRSIPLSGKVAIFMCPCDQRVILPPSTGDYFKVLHWYVISSVSSLHP